MTTPSNKDLSSFVEDVCGDSFFKVEDDLGCGFVRLKADEADRRQAAQDIKNAEDVLVELLRNSRDAHAKHIVVATKVDEKTRTIVVIDDGIGVPDQMRSMIFEPRVTSKLDTSHMDQWGLHGRGMALFSISERTDASSIIDSVEGLGTSISVTYNLDSLPEKTDQSTFPYFEEIDGTFAMRGPKNLLRNTAEFAFHCRDELDVYFGSYTEAISTMCMLGRNEIPVSVRAFETDYEDYPMTTWPIFATDPEELSAISKRLGLDISNRSARRILDGEVQPLPSLMERIQEESFTSKVRSKGDARTTKSKFHAVNESNASTARPYATPKIQEEDKLEMGDAIHKSFESLAKKYYLDSSVQPEIKITSGKLTVEIPLYDDE